MNISAFFIDRPIFASVVSILILTAGLVAMPLLPISEYPEIVPPDRSHQRHLPGRLAQDDRGDGHHAARAADQRRRECDLYQLLGDARRQLRNHRHLQAGDQSRHRAGTDPKPRQPGRAAPAGGRPADRPDHAEALARSHHGRISALRGRPLRLALPAQLRRHTGQGRARPPARNGRRARIRVRRLRHAPVARPGQDRLARHDCR